MLHTLKLNICFAEPVLSGEKNFEVRYNADRGFQKGDSVVFSVVDDVGTSIVHPISRERFKITYVISGFGLKENYVAFGIRKEG